MKIIFLDIDGVLNSEDWKARRPPKREKVGYRTRWLADAEQMYDPWCVLRLNKILEATGAVVVISSSQRKHNALPKLARGMKYQGLTLANRIIGATPSHAKTDEDTFKRACRGKEIQAWIHEVQGWYYKVDTDILIIDDDDDMNPWAQRLLQTSSTTGLSDADVEQAIGMLMEGKDNE